MIRIEEDDSSLFLFVPYNERERAKKVEGRRWDPERKCWIYPKTARVYDALIAEFGDELPISGVKRPSEAASAPTAKQAVAVTQRLEFENENLVKDLASIRESLELIQSSTPTRQKSEQVRVLLAERETELVTARAELAVAQREIGRLEIAVTAANRDMSRAMAERDSLKEHLKQHSSVTVDRKSKDTDGRLGVFAGLRRMARLTAANSPEFCLFLDGHTFGDSSPIEFGKLLERVLRTKLRTYDKLSLHDLIKQAEDAELLTDEGADFAHLIRKQRNQLAHDNASRITYDMRSVLSTSASALLYSELE